MGQREPIQNTMRTAILIGAVIIANAIRETATNPVKMSDTIATYIAYAIIFCILVDLVEFLNELFKG